LLVLTSSQVSALFPRAAPAHQAALANRGPTLFTRQGITGIRLQFFLAQLGHESAGLALMEEGLNYSAQGLVDTFGKYFPTLAAATPFARNPQKIANFVYGNRMGNGPPASGDGFRFRGRGYIQITGRENYGKFGAIAGVDLIANPDAAISADHALEIACGFWMFNKINPVADTGDFVAVTRKINGGTKGLADRRAWLDKVIRIMALPAQPVAPPAATVVAVQRTLQKAGFPGVGAADGDPGPRTMAAVTEFRRRNRLPPGGIDAALLKAMKIEV
jgi:putative chitinase